MNLYKDTALKKKEKKLYIDNLSMQKYTILLGANQNILGKLLPCATCTQIILFNTYTKSLP